MLPDDMRPGALLGSLTAAVAVGLALLPLSAAAATDARGLVWLVSAIVITARAAGRPEPSVGWTTLAGGNAVVGVGWLLHPDPTMLSLGGVAEIPLVVGLAVVGVGSVLLGPTDGHRTAVLDGLLAAFALGLAVGIAMVAPLGTAVTPGLVAVTVTLMVVTLATPAVAIVSLLTGFVRPGPAAGRIAVGVLAVLVAGTSTVMDAVQGVPIGAVASVAWVVAPTLATLVVVSSDPLYRHEPRPRRDVLASSRVATLLVLVAAPAMAGLWSEDAFLLQLSLAASMVAAMVLTVRIVSSVRHELEWAKEAADVRFDALVENAADVLALADGDGLLFYVSSQVATNFSVEPESLLGRRIEDVCHPEDRGRLADAVANARDRAGRPITLQVRIVDGTGRRRHVECTVVDLMELDGVNALSLTVRDVTERVLLEHELVRQVRIDDLTGLFSRHVLTDRVEHVLARRAHDCALLYLDVNDFKLINDGFGHAAGDRVLAAVGERIRGVLRKADSAGRLGGDEFAVLLEELPAASLADVLAVAERIHQACADPIDLGDGEHVVVRLAIGVATSEHGTSPGQLFAAADAAMYVSKREHRPTVVYEPGMNPSSRSRFLLMRDLRQAVVDGSLEVHYQPIHEVDSGRMHGVEALLRWEHPKHGWVPPPAILEHAEQAGITAELTLAILDEIGADLRRWHDDVGHPLEVSLNLSAEQLVHVDPDEVLRRTVGGREGGRFLAIEVTETSMLGDISAAARVLEAFRSAGCHVAVDDFGTGYASIGYLRRLPVDRLKIDREFVEGLGVEGATSSFAAVIHGLAHTLDLVTVAEGVETTEQLEAVRAIGCEYAQGWLLGRAVPIADLIGAVHDGTLDLHRPALREVPPRPSPDAADEPASLGWS